jgi:hypothetical protein
MKFGIVEPVNHSDRGNPGWHMINAGLRHLFRRAYPGAEFVSFPMMRPWNIEERARAGSCDVLVLAGNPRYDGGGHEWLYSGVMDQMIASGCRLVDAWQGAGLAHGNDVGRDAQHILSNQRNRRIMDRLQQFDAIITRDDRAQRANELAGLNSVQLPCSSWWASEEYGVTRTGGTDKILIAQNVQQATPVIRAHLDWRIVATSSHDHEHCRKIGVDAELIFKPLEILALFAQADTVVSCRLHSAIPAASLGCKTAIVAIDTRAQAGDAFGIPWATPGASLKPKHATQPQDPTDIIRSLL